MSKAQMQSRLAEMEATLSAQQAAIADLQIMLAATANEAQRSEATNASLVSSLPRQLAISSRPLSIDMEAFMRYAYDTSGDGDFNSFDFNRIFLGMNWDLGDSTKVRYTLEGGDIRENGDKQFELFTKHFFLEFNDTLYDSSYIRVGVTGLPWVGYEEGIWGYRVQGTVLPDRFGYMVGEDLGVAMGGKLSSGYGDWQVNVANGEGFAGAEKGSGKTYHGRLTVNPFPFSDSGWENVFVTGFASTGSHENDGSRQIAQIGYKDPSRFTFVSEYFRATDPAAMMAGRHPSLAARSGRESTANGTSIYSTINANAFAADSDPSRWEFIARWDHLDPDTDIDNNTIDLSILGVSYRYNDYVKFLADWEKIDYESGALKTDEELIMLHIQTNL